MAHAVNSVSRVESEANIRKWRQVEEDLRMEREAACRSDWHGKILLEIEVNDGTMTLVKIGCQKTRK